MTDTKSQAQKFLRALRKVKKNTHRQQQEINKDKQQEQNEVKLLKNNSTLCNDLYGERI